MAGSLATALPVALSFSVSVSLCACGSPAPPRVESATIGRAAGVPAVSLRGEPEGFVPRRSSRLHLTVPLPDGAAWQVDDRSTPDFVAEHLATQSKLVVHVSVEREVMNRARCEERARDAGFVPRAALKTIESATLAGPGELDTRVWVAVEPGTSDAAPVLGYVLAFGSHMRKCLFVRYETRVASARDGEELSARLALVRERVIPGIHVEPVLDAVQRATPELPKRRGGQQ